MTKNSFTFEDDCEGVELTVSTSIGTYTLLSMYGGSEFTLDREGLRELIRALQFIEGI